MGRHSVGIGQLLRLKAIVTPLGKDSLETIMAYSDMETVFSPLIILLWQY